MLVDISTVEEAVKFAQRIAYKMCKDPDIDSIAGIAAWKALYSYDKSKNVKLSWWIAQLTKQAVIHFWRRQTKLREKEQLMEEAWWEKVQEMEEESENNIANEDWQLLVESFILKYPLDVIARDRGVSLSAATKMRKAAISRLEAVC